MRFRRLVIPIVVFVVVVGGAFAAYQVADIGQDGAPAENATVVNETLVQHVGNWQLVNKSTEEFTTGFTENVTVYNHTNQTLTKGTDYQWNSTDGAIKFENTANTSDGNLSNITYVYTQNTEAVQQVSGPLAVVTRSVGESAYLVGGITIVIFLIAVAGYVGVVFARSGPQSRK